MMTMGSHLSHIRSKLGSGLIARFQLMPFQFFGEKEIHYEFYKELNKLRGADRRYKEMKIIREFPTSNFYKRRRNGLLIDAPNGKRAFIDLVIKHPSGDFGFEFYFGKETPNIEKNYFKDIYFLRKRNLKPDDVLKHTKNDCLKLKNELSLQSSCVIIFIASYHKSPDAFNYFKINKQKKIFQGLKKIREKTPGNIVIEYFERSYVNDLNVNDLKDEKWCHKQF